MAINSNTRLRFFHALLPLWQLENSVETVASYFPSSSYNLFIYAAAEKPLKLHKSLTCTAQVILNVSVTNLAATQHLLLKRIFWLKISECTCRVTAIHDWGTQYHLCSTCKGCEGWWLSICCGSMAMAEHKMAAQRKCPGLDFCMATAGLFTFFYTLCLIALLWFVFLAWCKTI